MGRAGFNHVSTFVSTAFWACAHHDAPPIFSIPPCNTILIAQVIAFTSRYGKSRNKIVNSCWGRVRKGCMFSKQFGSVFHWLYNFYCDCVLTIIAFANCTVVPKAPVLIEVIPFD